MKNLKNKIGGVVRSATTKLQNKFALMMSLVFVSALTGSAFAITAPAVGSFAYDIYDVGVNMLLKGAPGFVAGMASVIWAATKISTDWKMAGLGILGGSVLIKADAITTSLGLILGA